MILLNKLEIYTLDKKIIVKGVDSFSLKNTLESGQCFRFEEISCNTYEVIAFEKYIKVSEGEDNEVVFHNSNLEDVKNIWIPYFDLERNYSKIILSFKDNHLKTTAEKCSGIRILKQEPWEALCSFIISQNNNIPRIKKIIKLLCENFGDNIGENRFSFPSADKILSVGSLEIIRSGFRERYIKDAAEKVVSGEIDLIKIQLLPYEEAKEELKKIKGVGEKVASCTALFGLGFLNAFPVDVWINRVLEKYYGKDFDISYFGEYAGIAQQYLFHYERIYLTGEKCENTDCKRKRCIHSAVAN